MFGRKRRLLNSTRVWRSNNELAKERFRKLLEDEKAAALADDKFLDWLLKVKERKDDANLKATIACVPFYLFMALDLVASTFKVPIFGIPLENVAGLREGVLFCVVTLGLIQALQASDHANLNALIEVLFEKRYGSGAQGISHIFTTRHWLNLVPPADPIDPNLTEAWPRRALTRTFIFGFVATFSIALAAFATMWIGIVINTFKAPGLPWYWSQISGAYAICSILMQVAGQALLHNELPFWDVRAVNAVADKLRSGGAPGGRPK